MITFRLADALPSSMLNTLGAGAPGGARVSSRLEGLLDDGHGACLLRDQRLAQTVVDALRFFDGKRYELVAWVVMPNHVHVLIETYGGYPLADVVHSWKSYTAKSANKILGHSGTFWQPEHYDRAIRNERHLTASISYIDGNPVKAGLVDRPEEWLFSSATVVSPTPGAGETPALPGNSRGRLGSEDYS